MKTVSVLFTFFLLSGIANAATPPTALNDSSYADVLSVKTETQTDGVYFSVELKSPDTGCNQYANWWEVLSLDGKLLYRRILVHSHVDDQPFTRSGGPVKLNADSEVYVRAHMHPNGYGGKAMKGSAKNGFKPADLKPDFAASVEKQAPQAGNCAW